MKWDRFLNFLIKFYLIKFYFFNIKFFLNFIYFWLRWVSTAASGFLIAMASLVVEHGL